jgi:hypothetical protein
VYQLARILLAAALAAGAICAEEPNAKKYKSQEEFQLYDAAAKDLTAKNYTKALSDLDAWKSKFADSDFKAERQLLYVQTYAESKEPAKAVAAAGEMLAGDVDSALGNPGNVVKLLYTAVTAVQQIPTPTADQLATGQKAAQQLLAYDKKPEGVTDAAWKEASGQLHAAARGALLYIALEPGSEAMKKNDCAAAEIGFTKALEDHSESGQGAWYLGTAELCLYKADPSKASAALYEFARASVVDPAKGMVDPKWQQSTVDPYLQKVYEQYHGKDPDGLRQLKEQAKASALPPAGFKIKSVSEIAAEKQAQFEQSNPQLALWMKIKAALTAPDGQQYFANSVQSSALPQLRGTLVEAKPACRPKELLVAVPLPDATQPLQSEISLKLDKPLAGKPEPNTEFHFEGVPMAFTQMPFQLSMDADTSKIEGLATTPCGPAPARKRKK